MSCSCTTTETVDEPESYLVELTDAQLNWLDQQLEECEWNPENSSYDSGRAHDIRERLMSSDDAASVALVDASYYGQMVRLIHRAADLPVVFYNNDEDDFAVSLRALHEGINSLLFAAIA
jgi:hypothetical protein